MVARMLTFSATGSAALQRSSLLLNEIEEPLMATYVKDDVSQAVANSERPDNDRTEPHPEKSKTESLVGEGAREATRRCVERVDRYLARPDVIGVGRCEAPSFSSES